MFQNGVTALQVAIANDWEEVSDELAEHMEEFPGQRRLSLPVLYHVTYHVYYIILMTVDTYV